MPVDPLASLDINGLTKAEAHARLKRCGLNRFSRQTGTANAYRIREALS